MYPLADTYNEASVGVGGAVGSGHEVIGLENYIAVFGEAGACVPGLITEEAPAVPEYDYLTDEVLDFVFDLGGVALSFLG